MNTITNRKNEKLSIDKPTIPHDWEITVDWYDDKKLGGRSQYSVCKNCGCRRHVNYEIDYFFWYLPEGSDLDGRSSVPDCIKIKDLT